MSSSRSLTYDFDGSNLPVIGPSVSTFIPWFLALEIGGDFSAFLAGDNLPSTPPCWRVLHPPNSWVLSRRRIRGVRARTSASPRTLDPVATGYGYSGSRRAETSETLADASERQTSTPALLAQICEGGFREAIRREAPPGEVGVIRAPAAIRGGTRYSVGTSGLTTAPRLDARRFNKRPQTKRPQTREGLSPETGRKNAGPEPIATLQESFVF